MLLQIRATTAVVQLFRCNLRSIGRRRLELPALLQSGLLPAKPCGPSDRLKKLEGCFLIG